MSDFQPETKLSEGGWFLHDNEYVNGSKLWIGPYKTKDEALAASRYRIPWDDKDE